MGFYFINNNDQPDQHDYQQMVDKLNQMQDQDLEQLLQLLLGLDQSTTDSEFDWGVEDDHGVSDP